MPVALDFSRIIRNSRHVLLPEVGNIALFHLAALMQTRPERGAYGNLFSEVYQQWQYMDYSLLSEGSNF